MKVLRVFALLAAATACNLTFALTTKHEQQIAMEAIIAELKTHYGMAKFKEKMFGLQLEQLRLKYQGLIDQARTLEEEIGLDPAQSRELLPVEEFRQLMIGMVAELRDGHVNASRQTREVATLGLVAVNVGEKLIVTTTRPDLMVSHASAKEIKAGDEIIEVNGVPTIELAKRNLLYASGGTFEDRFSTAMLAIANNFHSFMRPVTEGASVTLKLRREGKEFLAHLRWVYRSDFDLLVARFPKHFGSQPIRMQAEDGNVPYGMRGAVRSYFKTGLLSTDAAKGMIDVGAILNREIQEAKEAEKKGEKRADVTIKELTPVERLQLYMVRRHGKNIGVLRIPSYHPGGGIQAVKAEYLWAAQGLKKLEELCDVLIIDQLSNTGGYVYYGTRLLSLFAFEKPLQAVLTDVKLNATVVEAHKPEFIKDYVDGNTPSYADWKLQMNYHDELKRRFQNGDQWTGLGPGFDLHAPQFKERPGEIFPGREAVFSKPVLILNDKMSGSGGDFFPAQMQANGRAQVMGETSSGLGGPVYRNIESMPGSEMNFRSTYAYAQLPDGWPIENIGVVPNVYRPIEVADITDGFKKFANQALEEAAKLAGWKPEEKAAQAAAVEPKKNEIQALVEILAKQSGAKYFASLGRLIDLARSEKPEAWKGVIVPLPAELKKDLILRTLWQRLEVLYRLMEMKHLKAWKDDPVVDRLIELAQALPAETRFADPCELRLTMGPLN